MHINPDEFLEVVPTMVSDQAPFPIVHDHDYLTVLSSSALVLTKEFRLENGEVKSIPYQQAKHFSAMRKPIGSLDDIHNIVLEASNNSNACLVRGVPHADANHVTRTNANFPEPSLGVHWVMLDIDKHELPAEVDPLSQQAIDHAIARLPGGFQDASYVFQHSSSAGILKADGSPLKPGLNVHIFFYLDQPMRTKLLAAYLKQHCINTGFYTFDARNALTIRYGLDMATIGASSQPHYVANPILGSGVQCQLTPETRLGIVRKAQDRVFLPVLPESLADDVRATASRLREVEADRIGLKTRVRQTRLASGISIQRYYDIPDTLRADLNVGRTFVSAALSECGQYAILHFEHEATPGSWFVSKVNPTVAWRYGDFASVPLDELCPGAYRHIRDTLQWFSEIDSPRLALQASGFLPPLDSFLTARFSLLLAPTGTGKTQAAIDWIRPQLAQKMVVYVAPRIVLVRQMEADLKARGIPHHVYTSIGASAELREGVVLTTSHSMPRILELVYRSGRPHILIVDEIHMALDEFMNTAQRLQCFERAITAASQAVFMTGTLTDLQRKTLSQVIIHAAPALADSEYSCYEFSPVKRNPLHIVTDHRFEHGLYLLLREYRRMLDAGEKLPRTVIIQDTSRLEFFKLLLARFNLSGYADVVSRKENTDDEVEQVVDSNKPLLVTTSLFGVGLNFVHPPERMYCCFDHIKSDTNQIVQTINRANRDSVTCEVRIYARSIDQEALRLPTNMTAKVKDGLEAEATVAGHLEQYEHIDRVAYQRLRDIEKNTAASIGFLQRHDCFQNYQIYSNDEQDERLTASDKEEIKELRGISRSMYDDRIKQSAINVRRVSEHREYFDRLEDLRKERSEKHLYEEPRTDQAVDNDVTGALMRICDIDDPKNGKGIVETKLAVLFGERFPWVSDQYNPAKSASHGMVVAEKLDSANQVLAFLCRLRDEDFPPAAIVSNFTRSLQLRKGFLALERSDTAYQEVFHRFECARATMDAARNKSRAARDEAKHEIMALIHGLIKSLGCYFEVERGSDGVLRTNYEKPVVPHSWNFGDMIQNLRGHIERFKALKPGEETLSLWIEDQKPSEGTRTLALCESCVFRWRNHCTKKNPNGFALGDYWTGETTCEGHVEISPGRHPTVLATKLPNLAANNA
jgi:hypothetical protein